MVRPRLSSDAHSSATPAFFEVLTSMLPDSVVGPLTRRCIGPPPMLTNGSSSASPIRASISRETFWCPRSIRFTALWLVFSTSASCCWVQPRCCRALRIRVPIWVR